AAAATVGARAGQSVADNRAWAISNLAMTRNRVRRSSPISTLSRWQRTPGSRRHQIRLFRYATPNAEARRRFRRAVAPRALRTAVGYQLLAAVVGVQPIL